MFDEIIDDGEITLTAASACGINNNNTFKLLDYLDIEDIQKIARNLCKVFYDNGLSNKSFISDKRYRLYDTDDFYSSEGSQHKDLLKYILKNYKIDIEELLEIENNSIKKLETEWKLEQIKNNPIITTKNRMVELHKYIENMRSEITKCENELKKLETSLIEIEKNNTTNPTPVYRKLISEFINVISDEA